jgi:uncharacterized protein (DUF1800 family)
MGDAIPHHAAIRFGLGVRLGEPPPADPRAWLLAQTGPAAAPAPAVTAAAALQARAEDTADRARDGAVPGAERRAQAFIQDAMQAWARQRLLSATPFRDRLADFWMNHFTTSRRVGAASVLVGTLEQEAIRPHLAGRFEDMLLAVVRHPAMLLYLDNASSVGPNSRFGSRSGRGLNENLAREVLELHTLSPAGGYTQGDVTQLARVLTGWSVEQRRPPLGFVFRAATHEPGGKAVLGRLFEEGEAAGEAALRFLAVQPATHRHLAVKLARHFVADDPPPAAVRAIEGALRDTGGELGAAAQALVRLEAAWATPLAKLRTPQDFVLAACRGVALEPEREPLVLQAMVALAQPLWAAPQPNGWPDQAASWAGPEALMRRAEWAYGLAARFPRLEPRAVAEAVLGPLARAETAQAIARAGSVRDALTLLFASPEFQRR